MARASSYRERVQIDADRAHPGGARLDQRGAAAAERVHHRGVARGVAGEGVDQHPRRRRVHARRVGVQRVGQALGGDVVVDGGAQGRLADAGGARLAGAGDGAGRPRHRQRAARAGTGGGGLHG
ncbi:MAG: hypothetical protein R2939_00520 [Kofleriaceae bacterium]